MTLALALLIAAPAAATDDPLSKLEARHEAVVEEARSHFEAMRSLRESLPYSPEPERVLARWDTHLNDVRLLISENNRLREDHRRRLTALEGAAAGRALAKTLHRRGGFDSRTVTIYAHEAASTEMQQASEGLYAVLARESEAFGLAETAHRDLVRKNRILYWVAGAAVFLLLLALVLTLGRRTPALPPPESAPLAPLRLLGGNFQLGPLIGRGAMGEVFSAVDKTLTRRVALKRMRPELLAEPKDRERFLSEARLVAALKHPNIVAIHSVVQEGGETYLVFEFVDGKTLEELIREKSRLPWQEALGCLKSVCSALEFAHGKGVIHRDLKPGNIMLTPEGALKVMDFGIAHQARVSASRMTRATSVGTPPYMSPEQELGGVSAGVDLYAATVCFYEMLTGRLPFSGPNFLAQKREEVYEPASSSAPGLPPGIDAFFKAALSPRPSRRPKDAAALFAAAAAAGAP